MGEDLQPSLKQLDVLVLSRLVLQKTLGFSLEDLDDDRGSLPVEAAIEVFRQVGPAAVAGGLSSRGHA